MIQIDPYIVVDNLINQYDLNPKDDKKTIFNKTREYLYDYFRSVEQENCIEAMDCANTIACDTQNLKQIFNEIKERQHV
jgi:hypothetical protein